MCFLLVESNPSLLSNKHRNKVQFYSFEDSPFLSICLTAVIMLFLLHWALWLIGSFNLWDKWSEEALTFQSSYSSPPSSDHPPPHLLLHHFSSSCVSLSLLFCCLLFASSHFSSLCLHFVTINKIQWHLTSPPTHNHPCKHMAKGVADDRALLNDVTSPSSKLLDLIYLDFHLHL